MTITFQLSPSASETCAAVSDYAHLAAARHAWPVGVCEMAAGAAVLTAGLAARALQLGVDMVLHPLGPGPVVPVHGEALCAVLGLLPGLMLDGTGIADAGPALVLPALALVAGGGALLGLAGCGSAVQARQFLSGVPQGGAALPAGAWLATGFVLWVQGAQRLVGGTRAPGEQALCDGDRLTLYRRPTRRAITTWTGVASYAHSLGTLGAAWDGPSPALSAAAASLAAPSAEERFIRLALHHRPAPVAATLGFDVPRQAGAEAD